MSSQVILGEDYMLEGTEVNNILSFAFRITEQVKTNSIHKYL